MDAITQFLRELFVAGPMPSSTGLVVTATIIKAIVIMGVIFSITGYIVLLERRVIARLQHRVGPNRAGPFGMLQPIADVLKLLTKEDSLPPFVDKWLFILAPSIIAVTGLLGLGLIPWGDADANHWYAVTNNNLGALLFLAFSSVGVYSIVLAGWASNSKYAVIGGLRATAQMISYELSMSLSILSVVILAGTLNLNHIVKAQEPLWFIILQPLGFLIFLVSAVAESRRAPFDLPEAENEIVAGFHTEYSSMKFALFFLGEYIGVLMLSAIMAILYLGGWQGPFADGPWWLLLKIFLIVFFFIWIRATFPRIRADHLMELGWKWMIPLSILNLVITVVLVLAKPDLIPLVAQ